MFDGGSILPKMQVKSKHSWLTVVTAPYLTGVGIWFGLWWVTGDRFWWMVGLNRSEWLLFAPAPILILAALWQKKWRLAAAAALPLLLALWLYQPYWRLQLAPTPPPDLSVMTYNVLFSNQAYDETAAVILAYRPDLVALQEVQPRMMAELEKRLAGVYPYALMGPRHPYGTTAVFSRHPILARQILDLEDDRPATLVTIEKGGTPVTWTAVHLRAYELRWLPRLQIPAAVRERTQRQNRQAAILLEALAGREGVTLIGCDCNSKELSSSYRLLRVDFANAAHSHGRFFPPAPLPGAQPDTRPGHIDYILYRGGLTPAGTYVIQNRGGSDHQPVIAFFAFQQVPE